MVRPRSQNVDLQHAATARIERDGDRQVLVLDDGATAVRIVLPIRYADLALTRIAQQIGRLATEVRFNDLAGFHGPLNGP